MNEIENQEISRSFSQAAKNYDNASYLQKDVADRLLKRLDELSLSPKKILDAGCGTGYCTRRLSNKFPTANVYGIDIAEGMVQQAKSNQQNINGTENKNVQYKKADISKLPYTDNQFDLVFSSLAFQWLKDPIDAYQEISRVLKPNGQLVFSSMGEQTLFELKRSWQQVDSEVHVNQFYKINEVEEQISRASFNEVTVRQDIITLEYEKMILLMKNLKAIGASNLNKKRPKGLQGRSKFNLLQKAYDEFKNDKGLLPATYDVIYCLAKKPNQKAFN